GRRCVERVELFRLLRRVRRVERRQQLEVRFCGLDRLRRLAWQGVRLHARRIGLSGDALERTVRPERGMEGLQLFYLTLRTVDTSSGNSDSRDSPDDRARIRGCA